MNPEKYITLLDPVLKSNNEEISSNLGDLIISRSMISILSDIFPEKEIIRFSPSADLDNKQKKLIQKAAYSFIGGSNLLFSDLRDYRQILIRKGKLLWLIPGIKNMILFGPGWGEGYGNKSTLKTRLFYKNILSSKYIHAVRDEYSEEKLKSEINYKVLNTNCPSTWTLDGKKTNLQNKSTTVLFTLTDYNKEITTDNILIQNLCEYFKQLVFFPQGANDIEYITTLEQYIKNKGRINMLPFDLGSFDSFIKTEDFNYVGTRLHGGIRCIQQDKAALILSVDHRALEMAKNSGLPVIKRNDLGLLKKWLEGNKIFNTNITLPIKNINNWRQQFN
ncbi:MAG: polysaccharide pyruvyl transferase family protein [Chitinophagaceae bacterium]|nr:polysaccharide pyruvyl transferase family protein [Chitinophagaceae bacterium]